MRVGVGYSDTPNTGEAGVQAAKNALRQAGAESACDLVLMFATARHDAATLRKAVASVVGAEVPIVGGGAVGAISAEAFGYAGDQIILALFWLEGVRCDLIAEPGLLDGEEEVGYRIGKKLSEMAIAPDSPILLFYDAIDRTQGDMRMIMCTPLLAGIARGLHFAPNLVGAGLQGDYLCTATEQWIGRDIVQHHAIALAFSGEIQVDSVIMHGCRPLSDYYTVTKADKQTILEIDGQPAIDFIDRLLGQAIAPEEYPFFLILGVNQGDKWGEYNEEDYANRLCLAIDKERGGIVMFEPDMVEGTRFQIMYRSLELDYMPPKIESLFERLGDRKPVLATYIDCAGRAAGYGGTDMEDAVLLQRQIGDRVPLLGIYTGVEIAPVKGCPRGLDWTGVFSLFSVPR